MYGRGNYGQGLQRPMPPYQQNRPSATPFQPRNTVPIIQRGGPPPPSGLAYLHAHPTPPNMLPHQPPQPYLHQPPPPPPFLGTQQNFVSGHQNPQPPPPPPSSIGTRAPPPLPPSMGSRGPPPPPPFMHLPPPPPPPLATPQPPPLPPSPPRVPPPPSSTSQTLSGHGPVPEQVLVSESSGNSTIHSQKSGDTPISNTDMSLKRDLLEGLSLPPPKPRDEDVVRNIQVLCQFIAKNGPEFEEMARKNESGNPNFNFLVGGDPGSEAAIAHEYFLWMKKNCNVENNLQKDQGQMDLSQRDFDVELSSGPNVLPNVERTHSPGDSDVDMEDDITQSDKEHGTYNSIENVGPEAVVPSDANEIPTHDNANELPDLKDVSPALNSSHSVNIQADPASNPENPVGQPTNLDSPFKLIQNYASDDSSDDGEKRPENATGMDYPNNESDIGLGQPVTTCLESELVKDRDDLPEIHGDLQAAPDNNASRGKNEIDESGRMEGIDTNTGSHLQYASGSSGVGSTPTNKDGEKEKEKKITLSVTKVDEFGRLVKEDGSDSGSDKSHHLRRRGRRERSRSRSHSRSPSDRWRRRSPRRSPRRRKDRRSGSRSFSPKRRRSRSRSKSRSPYRYERDFYVDKSRRTKVETPKCFDFLKGRCYRGSACRYLHHDPIKDENPRRYNSKQYHESDYRDNRDLISQKGDERNISQVMDDPTGRSVVSHQNTERLRTDAKDQELISDHRTCEEQSTSIMPSTNEQVVIHSQAEGSTETYRKDDNDDLLKKDGLSKIDSSSIHTSTIPPSGISVNEPSIDYILKESSAPNTTESDLSRPVSHLPTPPLPQQASNPHHNYMAPSGSFPPQSVPIQSGPMYHASVTNQHSHYHVPPNAAWGGPLQTLPPGPPHMVGPSTPGHPLQIQQGNFPGQMPLRPPLGELPIHSQVGGFSHQTYNFPPGNVQPGSHIARDDRYPQFPTQNIVPSSSFLPGVAPQPVPFQGDSNFLDKADSSSFFNVGGTRISTHYNPYASTFDQPLSTKFSTIAFSQGRETADASSRQIISSNSSKGGPQTVLKSSGDQYDPLFDCIDQKHAQKQDQVVESLENDEFGETAETEVGAVENGSPSNPNEDPDIAQGDIEIDQVKSEGRSKKNKESRSMKLFKVGVANFVKDMLKPQWRQGNMSKEVFKTIVKKTVDKVSGAMKDHRLPKSQAKIDHYIDSSRRKLTQLVEGYVSKYMN